MIVPRSNFSCNGRITGYLISLDSNGNSGDYPIVQVWHPTDSSFTVYTKIDNECPLTASDITMMSGGNGDYYLGNVSCTGTNRIEFQAGDVIGYYHGSSVCYRLWRTDTGGYTSYHWDVSSPLTDFDISINNGTTPNRQPLIQVMYGK